MAAITQAVATGHITPGEATEIAKVIDAYVKAYCAAELDERVARVEQLSDAELTRIANSGRTIEARPLHPPPPQVQGGVR
jgi:hypothetical protein